MKLGKGLFHIVTNTFTEGGSESGCREVTVEEDDKLFYTPCPDLLIEDGNVYFSDTGLNASIDEVEGRLYAEVVSA